MTHFFDQLLWLFFCGELRYNGDMKNMGKIQQIEEEIKNLHYIARLSDEEPHDEVGSKKAYQMLIEKGFNRELAEKVKSIILTHRCRKYPPETLEQKIVASADAMAHFIPPFYFWVGKYSIKNFVEILDGNMRKVKKDYNQKIFFKDEKKMVEEQYKMLKNWFNYK